MTAASASSGDALAARAMDLFKQALASGDATALHAFLAETLARPDAAARERLAELFRAERARLVKLKTLGLTGDFDAKIRLTEAALALTRGVTPGDD